MVEGSGRALDLRATADLAVKLTQEFVRVPTMNPPGSESALAQLVMSRARELGIAGEIREVENGRDNVILTVPGTGDAHTVLYCGHLDTVPLGNVPWSFEPLDGGIVSGRILGRGSSDMKGGLAAMLAGMAALNAADVPLPGDLVLAAVIGEEVDCAGSAAFLASGGMADVGALVISEPTNMDVVIAHKGAVRLTVTAYGRAAHSSTPHLGVNAISAMTHFVQRLDDVRLGSLPHSLLGYPTISVNTITGGVRPNIVADVCAVGVDVRTLPGQRADVVISALRNVADDLESEIPGLRLELTTTQDVAAVETPADSALVQTALSTASEVTGEQPNVRGLALFSDASVLQPASLVPTILYGPGDEALAHQVDEYVDVDKVAAAAQVFARLPGRYFEGVR